MKIYKKCLPLVAVLSFGAGMAQADNVDDILAQHSDW